MLDSVASCLTMLRRFGLQAGSSRAHQSPPSVHCLVIRPSGVLCRTLLCLKGAPLLRYLCLPICVASPSDHLLYHGSRSPHPRRPHPNNPLTNAFTAPGPYINPAVPSLALPPLSHTLLLSQQSTHFHLSTRLGLHCLTPLSTATGAISVISTSSIATPASSPQPHAPQHACLPPQP